MDVNGSLIAVELFGAEYGGARVDVRYGASESLGMEGSAGVASAGWVRVSGTSGDAVLALGRLTWEGGRPLLRATGPGSLVLFTSAPGTSARRELERQRRHHYLGLGLLVLCAALPVAFGIL